MYSTHTDARASRAPLSVGSIESVCDTRSGALVSDCGDTPRIYVDYTLTICTGRALYVLSRAAGDRDRQLLLHLPDTGCLASNQQPSAPHMYDSACLRPGYPREGGG